MRVLLLVFCSSLTLPLSSLQAEPLRLRLVAARGLVFDSRVFKYLERVDPVQKDDSGSPKRPSAGDE